MAPPRRGESRRPPPAGHGENPGRDAATRPARRAPRLQPDVHAASAPRAMTSAIAAPIGMNGNDIVKVSPSSMTPSKPLLYLIDGSSQMYRAFHAPIRTAEGTLLR